MPYARYGETAESVHGQIALVADAIAAGTGREKLQTLMPAGAARNAVDCALWDLEAKIAGKRVWQLAGLEAPQQLTTAYTLSPETPEIMEESARSAAHRPLLKVKLGGDGDAERIAAVRAGAPQSDIIVDANEGWSPDKLVTMFSACADAQVSLVEQPLPAGKDAALADIPHPILVCADESAHDRATLQALVGCYDAINIKLDKTGGLTEALALERAAREAGLKIMVGCTLGTSLGMAPALPGGIACHRRRSRRPAPASERPRSRPDL